MGKGVSDSVLLENERDIDVAETGIILGLKTSDFSMEAFYTPHSSLEYEDPSSDGYERVGWTVMVSLTGEHIALGAMKSSGETTYEGRSPEVEGGVFGAGLSFRFFEWFHVGGGRTRGWEYESDRVKISWVDYYTGAAILAGTPGDVLFRVEYSRMTSPETKNEAKGIEGSTGYLAENVHHKTTEERQSAELAVYDVLFSYMRTDRTEGNPDDLSGFTEVGDTKSATNRIGVGWISPSGWVLTLYRIALKQETDYTRNDGSPATSSDTSTTLKINLGYAF
ncbi:MAG: hypothetical protein GY866_14295 [Proteobacteria bacterium]|nr:hypothetical protein [Pseudomonadota bacterium]